MNYGMIGSKLISSEKYTLPDYVISGPFPQYYSYGHIGIFTFQSYYGGYSYKISRIDNHCIYYQYVPTDNFDKLLIEWYSAMLYKKYLFQMMFSSQSDITEHAPMTPSNVTINFYDPNNYMYPKSARNYYTILCSDDITMNIALGATQEYIYLHNGMIHLSGIEQFSFRTDTILYGCTWAGISMRIVIVDGSVICQTIHVTNNIDVFPVTSRCEQYTLTFLHEGDISVAPAESFYEYLTQHKLSKWNIKLSKILFTFLQYNELLESFEGYYNVSTVWTLYANLSYSSNENYIVYKVSSECSNIFKQISVYTIYYTVMDKTYVYTSYMIFEDYVGIMPETFVAQPTYHGAGIFLVGNDSISPQTWNRKCDVKVHYQIYSPNPYVSSPHYTIHNGAKSYKNWYNSWHMCTNHSCYMVHDSSAMPEPTTWEEAAAFCQTKHGRLFTVNSDAEQIAVVDWIMTKRRRMSDTFYGYLQQHARATVMFLGLRLTEVNIFVA
jgi:hypothetical protein